MALFQIKINEIDDENVFPANIDVTRLAQVSFKRGEDLQDDFYAYKDTSIFLNNFHEIRTKDPELKAIYRELLNEPELKVDIFLPLLFRKCLDAEWVFENQHFKGLKIKEAEI